MKKKELLATLFIPCRQSPCKDIFTSVELLVSVENVTACFHSSRKHLCVLIYYITMVGTTSGRPINSSEFPLQPLPLITKQITLPISLKPRNDDFPFDLQRGVKYIQQ
jgi:hypothetical protein